MIGDSEYNFDEDLFDAPMIEKWRRDYSLGDFPRDEFGDILPLKDTEKDFLIYLEWLADYLYNAPPVEAMYQMIEKNLDTDKTPSHQILILASDASIYDLEISIYDDYFENPQAIDETQLLPVFVKQAAFENEQKQLCGLTNIPCANFSDIAWRVSLSWILKKVSDKKERIELLKTYFEEYEYMSHK